MVIDNYLPVTGGAERQVERLGKGLVKRGIDVRIVTERKEKDWKGYEVVNGLPVVRLSFPHVRLLGALILYIKLALYLFKVRREYDVIHVHIVKYLAFVGSIVGRVLNKRVVLKFTGWEELDRGVLNEGHRKRLVFRIIDWGIRKADFFVATSREIESSLRRFGFPDEKIVYIPNGVDTQIFSPVKDRKEIRGKLGIKGDLIALFVGRLVKEKGLVYLIDAWGEVVRRFPDASLHIIGDGYLFNELKQRVNRDGLNGKVFFTGFVENAQEYMSAADVFIIPSIMEGLSNALIEAMASGLPVVGTAVSGNEDLIIDGENGFLIPSMDSSAIAGAISSLFDDERRRVSMGEMSRRIIEQGFSIDSVVDRYIRVYRDTIVVQDTLSGS